MNATERYTPTEARYKGGADEMYITYDLKQRTRGGETAKYPEVKRVYVAGDVTGWRAGDFEKRSGARVHGVKIEYEQTRKGYRRAGYKATRSDTGKTYEVPPVTVEPARQHYAHIIEVPTEAENVQFRGTELPREYASALQDVR